MGVDVEGGESLAPVEEVKGPWRQTCVAVPMVWSLSHRLPVLVIGFTLLRICVNEV